MQHDVLRPPRGPAPRSVHLVVLDGEGAIRGRTKQPIPVATPWWPEMKPVVDAAREALGLDVVVLRLLHGVSDRAAGGEVTYLVSTDAVLDLARATELLEPSAVRSDDHPLRQRWARPGGPQADLAWATAAIEARGHRRTAAPVQIRSWNLSSLWRIPTDAGDVWLKHVPPFFAHEGAILERLAGRSVPAILARDGGRVLMREVPGADLYDAELPILEGLVRLLVDLQAEWCGRDDGLLALGLPDWRGPALTAAIADVVTRSSGLLDPTERAVLERFVNELPERFAALAATGFPDTLVHGDFHPGNARGDEAVGSLTVLDWGDSGIGHPLLDQAAFLDRIPSQHERRIGDAWNEAWRSALPGSRPEIAARLIGPIAAARQAVIYRGFLDRIEPSEHAYHRNDPEDWLRRTIGRLAREADPASGAAAAES
ncbi:MAG: hypothetical protein QOF49_1277 [Chloroflexota bacterium]|jgi:hypothetical protein|nr:hypothetical protein [Chloroflexota bacterium]